MRRYQIIPLVLVGLLSAVCGAAAGYALGISGLASQMDPANYPIQYLGAADLPPGIEESYDTHVSISDNDHEEPEGNSDLFPRYILTTDHGFVAVFHFSESSPRGHLKERTLTPESALSPEERQRLRSGIYIYTEEELVRALEDYGS